MMAHPIRYALYSLLPKATLSRWTGRLLSAQLPLISPLMKRLFVAIYKPNLDEAEHTISHYPTAQALFTRRLKPGARPLADGELISPVDGRFRFSGEMATSPATLIQAKGIEYTLPQLIGDQQLAEHFVGGSWAVLYLAPHNYHRIHSPCDGEVVETLYLPGQFWPVNDWSVETVPSLFAVNERMVTRLRHPSGAEALVVMVAATNVGQIKLSYSDRVVGNSSRKRTPLRWGETGLHLKRGEELGVFQFGSTVVLILDKEWKTVAPDHFQLESYSVIRMGQLL